MPTDEAVPLDQLDQKSYNAARANGDTDVAVPVEKPPDVTGKESQKEYNAARDEQTGQFKKGGGYQKRIDHLTRKNAILAEKLSKYEAPGAMEARVFGKIAERNAAESGNGNGAVRMDETSMKGYKELREQGLTDPGPIEVPEESQPERATGEVEPENRGAESQDPKMRELQARYPDFVEVMERAQSMNLRIADEAAAEMHASDNAGHIAYMLARNPELLTQFNKLSAQQQLAEIRRINGQMEAMESGKIPFAQRVRENLSKEDFLTATEAIKGNELGSRVVLSLVRELNLLPNGPQVFKALITDPETCQRLAGLSQSGAALELGRISVRLENRDGRGRFTSKAPEPIRPVGSSGAGHSTPLDKISEMSDYRKARASGRVR